ncbi:MAG: ribosome-associated translation inhibitor RaiA [Methylophilaceae bacterium]
MQKIPLQITFHNMPPSEALEVHIRDRVQKLDRLFAHVISCHVVVDMPHRHQQQGKQFNVRISLDMPGNKIIINRDHHEDVYAALRDAFDAARHQLEDYKSRVQRTTKTHILEQVGCMTRILHWDGLGFSSGTDRSPAATHYGSRRNRERSVGHHH